MSGLWFNIALPHIIDALAKDVSMLLHLTAYYG